MKLLSRALIVVIAVTLAATSVGSATAGGANPYVVTRDDDPTPDGCIPSDCSLREAIIDSNATSAADIIILAGALHVTLSISGTDDNSAAGDLDITDDLRILGEDPDNTTIDGDQIDRVIDIPSPQGGDQSEINVELSHLTVTGGTHSGIHSTGYLTLEEVVVFGNISDGDGGGIDSELGSLIMEHSTVGKNSAQNKGGGIAAHRATTIRDSTIWVNNASGGAGGIWATGGITLTNVTLDRNSAGFGTGPGGVLIESAPGTILNTTISENSSFASAGGIWNSGADVTMNTTIVSGNTSNSVPFDCLGVFSGDNNLVQEPTLGCNLTGANNITGEDPMLTDLANHGGPTQTRAILKDSPARDNGFAAGCMAEDQRGIQRPQGAECDIGAYEYMFLGDVDCDGFAALPDVNAYLGWLAGGDEPGCSYRGDLQCNLDFGVIDVLFLLRAYSLLELLPPARPDWCGEIGPFEP